MKSLSGKVVIFIIACVSVVVLIATMVIPIVLDQFYRQIYSEGEPTRTLGNIGSIMRD